jgi:hypothetical protein
LVFVPGLALCKLQAQAMVSDLEARLAALEAQLASMTMNEAKAFKSLQIDEKQAGHDINTSWLILTSTLVFLMQLGFAMLECGMCRQNNVVATYAKNILDVVFGSLVSYFWGFELAYGMSVRASTSTHQLEPGTTSSRRVVRHHHAVSLSDDIRGVMLSSSCD